MLHKTYTTVISTHIHVVYQPPLPYGSICDQSNKEHSATTQIMPLIKTTTIHTQNTEIFSSITTANKNTSQCSVCQTFLPTITVFQHNFKGL